MTHPLAYMLAHRPKMLVVHAQAYADLLSADASLALRQAKVKALLGIMTLCMAVVAMVLTGVAVIHVAHDRCHPFAPACKAERLQVGNGLHVGKLAVHLSPGSGLDVATKVPRESDGGDGEAGAGEELRHGEALSAGDSPRVGE